MWMTNEQLSEISRRVKNYMSHNGMRFYISWDVYIQICQLWDQESEVS